VGLVAYVRAIANTNVVIKPEWKVCLEELGR
jgi:hypothetical protein